MPQTQYIVSGDFFGLYLINCCKRCKSAVLIELIFILLFIHVEIFVINYHAGFPVSPARVNLL